MIAAAPWLMAGGGALAGLMGGKSKSQPRTTTQSQTQTRAPWAQTVPYLNDIMGNAAGIYHGFTPTNPYSQPFRGGGASPETKAVAGDITGLYRGGSPFLDAASGAMPDLLAADPSNPFKQQMLGGGQVANPYINNFIQAAMQQGFGGPGQGGDLLGGGTSYGGGGTISFGGGGPVGGASSTATDFINRTLGGDFLNANPYQDAVDAAIRRQAEKAFTETQLPQIQSQLALGGNWTSGIRQALQQQAATQNAQNTTDAIANQRYQNYQNERGLQNSALGTQAQLDAAGMAARASGAGAAASAMAARNANQIAQQRLALDRQLGFAGLGLQGMDLLSGDQQFNQNILQQASQAQDAYNLGLLGFKGDLLGLAPGLESARYTGPVAAGQLYQGIDQQNAAGALANYGNQVAGQQWANQLPWDQLSQYANLLFPLATGFGSSTGSGSQTIPGQPRDPFGDLLSGAMGGYMAGQGLQGLGGGGGGYGTAFGFPF